MATEEDKKAVKKKKKKPLKKKASYAGTNGTHKATAERIIKESKKEKGKK